MNVRNSIIEHIISEGNIQFYNDFGYLIAPKILDTNAIEELNNEAVKIVTGQRGDIGGLLAANSVLSPEDTLKQYAAVHFPHKISSLMKDYAKHPKVSKIVSRIISPNVKCMQTMLFMKAPGKAGQSWHQDEYYIPTRDQSLTGGWLALDDANEENGCLWVIPGSHKEPYIRKRIPNSNNEFADVDVADISPYTKEDFLKVEVKAGSMVFFNGYLLHMSLKNKSVDRFRRALVSHYCSAESMLPWDQDGRLKLASDFRDIFMVSGTDPYEYKGVEDVSRPFVRPDVLDFNTDEARKKHSQQ